MKKLIVFLAGIVTLFTCAVTPAATAANVNNFTITNYDIHYTLGRDSENRSTLTTTETITADFPASDQNHGIERYIPNTYDGHQTNLAIQSITNKAGQLWSYTTYKSGDYTVARIGDASRYVHGEQVFKITYTQRDVTKVFADTNSDEFYWDTNGTEWRAPIQSLTVSLSIDDSLQSALTGNTACYQGGYGTNQLCALNKDSKGGSTIFTASARSLAPGENITMAIGFTKGSFMPYQKSPWEIFAQIWFIVQCILGPISVLIIILLVVRYKQWSNRKKDIGTVIPEYTPPANASVQTSAAIIAATARSSFAAQLVDLAVRHYTRIVETAPKKIFTPAEYEFEILKSTDDLHDEEKEFIQDVFKSTTVGTKTNTTTLRKDHKLSIRFMDNPGKLQELIRGSYGLREKVPEKSGWFKSFSLTMLAPSIVLMSPLLLVVTIIAAILGSMLWPLTDKGVELKRYLEGLKLYISVAEVERLKMLQSPEGAAKVSIDANDQKQLVKLYEKVLPYAMLFGQETGWNKQLGNYYQSTGSQPDWYSGGSMAAFNAAAFSSAMSNLATSVSSTGASSSSSGGSSGGGFSGGGGGGGGGGGW